jgi:adenylate kinase family enzyme
MTSELLPYYETRGILKRIDGVGSVDEVRDRVFQALSAFLARDGLKRDGN